MSTLTHRIGRRFACLAIVSMAGCMSPPQSEQWAPSAHDSLAEALREGAVLGSDLGIECRAETLTTETDVFVRISLANDSDRSFEFLTWGTPWDELANPLVLTGPAGELDYRGFVAHRVGVSDEDFAAIAPGDSAVLDYPLSERYPVERDGVYEVALREPVVHARIDGLERWIVVDCGVGEASLAAAAGQDVAVSQQALSAADGCTASQRTALERAFPVAYSAAYAAQRMLTPGDMYGRFFGSFDADNARDLADQYESIVGSDWGFAFGCGAPTFPQNYCAANVIAVQIDWGAWDQVYTCPLFYDASRLNADGRTQSRAEVLLHELTHTRDPWRASDVRDLGQCGGTCYGLPLALALARDPTCTGSDASSCKAVQNADNIGFFAMQAYLGLLPAIL